jgi:PAS domain S-box-containing protein
MLDQEKIHPVDANRYQIAMEATGVGVWDWDVVRDEHFWSKEYKVILGLPQDAPASFATFRALIHPDDQERVFTLFLEHFRTKTLDYFECRVCWPDGSVHWIANRGRFICDEQGQIIRLTGVIWEITAQKQAEEERREAIRQAERKQAFLQTIMRQIPSGMVIAEAPSGKIISYNEEAAIILGRSFLVAETTADYTRFDFMRPNGIPYPVNDTPLARAILLGETIRQEKMLCRRENGSVIPLSSNAAPIYDRQGRMLAGVAIFQDISEQLELERQKEDFICLASHELRTPLTSLKGNLQLMERRLQRRLREYRQTLSEEEKQFLEQVVSWNQRAQRQAAIENHLIDNLLDANSLQAQELHVSFETANLTHLVKSAIDDMLTITAPRTLVLDNPSDFAIRVYVDKIRIWQVLTNYLKNALRYASEEQPVIVGIALEGHIVRVWVKDSGPGLSSEQQHKLWNRFRQVTGLSGYNCPGGGGLGLGLYLCRELIKLHGGQTGVESAPGKGATFWFTLPLEQPWSNGQCVEEQPSPLPH